MRQPVAAWMLASLCALAQAQPATPEPTPPGPAPAPAPTPIAYPSVAEALRALEARDGDGTVVSHSDGWTIINEPLASAQWSFAPKDHPAYPAVVRRVIVRGPNRAVNVDTTSLCEAPAAACQQLLQEFSAMNDRITQAAKARTRSASPTPTAP